MLAVDDPASATSATRLWNGTAYFIFEDIETDNMPWITCNNLAFYI